MRVSPFSELHVHTVKPVTLRMAQSVALGTRNVNKHTFIGNIISIHNLYLMHEMIIPGSSYWNMAIGFDKGEVEKDAEGIDTMKTLGQTMAWLLKKLN